MAPGFAAGLAARVAMLRLAERLPGGRLVASEFQGDAAPEVGPGVAAVDREGFVELGQRLLHLAFLQPAPAFGHVVIGVGDELDVEHRPPHHVSEHHAERAEPPEAGHFRSRHHRDGDLGDLLAAELDAHPRVLALGHQIARLGADLRQGPLQPFGQIDRHLLGRLSGLLRGRARLVGEVRNLPGGAVRDLRPLAVAGRLLGGLRRGPASLARRPADHAPPAPVRLLLAALAFGHPFLRQGAVCSGAVPAATRLGRKWACTAAARRAHHGHAPPPRARRPDPHSRAAGALPSPLAFARRRRPGGAPTASGAAVARALGPRRTRRLVRGAARSLVLAGGRRAGSERPPRRRQRGSPPRRRRCGAGGKTFAPPLASFGAAALLDLERTCPGCGARLDLGRDRGRLRSGAVFLLEELCARAALSVELPRAPRDEELPDAAVAALLREAFGDYDELADDGVEPA